MLVTACDRPVARLGPDVAIVGSARLEGRVVHPDDDDPTVPWTSVGEDELKDATLEWREDGGESGPARTDDEGWVRVRLPRRVGPGLHRVHLRDAHKNRLGSTTVRVLDPESAPRIVRSDVDLTYLDTRFQSAADLAALLRAPASAHAPLEGMPALYRSLRVSVLSFLSGSPELFRAHLQARLALDGIRFDALRLKPMGAVAKRELAKGRNGDVAAALREQLGYKVIALLEDRLRLPARSREVLLGDDSEMDPFAYFLYREASAGRLQGVDLRRRMIDLGAPETDVARALRLAPAVRRHLGDHESVAAIFIRRTGRPNAAHSAEALANAGLRFHADTRELRAALAEMGWAR